MTTTMLNFMVQARWAAEHPLTNPANHAASCCIHLPTMQDSCDCGRGAR